MGEIDKDNYHPDFQWLRLAAEKSPNTGGIAIYGRIRQPYSDEATAARLVDLMFHEEDYTSVAVYHPPAFWLTKENAQEFMDDLWNCGIRPTDMGEAVGALPATEKHLEDMQKVFNKYVLGDE